MRKVRGRAEEGMLSACGFHGADIGLLVRAGSTQIQGVEFVTRGRIALPVLEPDPTFLRAVRRFLISWTKRVSMSGCTIRLGHWPSR